MIAASRGPAGFIAGAVLGLESSGRLTGAALVRDGRLVAESALDARADSQEVLLDIVLRLLAAQRLTPAGLARIGIALGPGSFTGIRVGVAAGRALALGAGVPGVGVPSHEALAWPWRDLGRVIVLLTGMRRGEVCVEAGRWDDLLWSPILEAASLPVAEVAPRLRPLGRELLFVGDSVESVLRTSPALEEQGLPVREPLATARRPAAIALLAARTEVEECAGWEIERLVPLYVRGADARRPGQRVGGS